VSQKKKKERKREREGGREEGRKEERKAKTGRHGFIILNTPTEGVLV
jgi:hypothetical protein